MITFTPQVISQIAETVYADHDRRSGGLMTNWANLKQSERDEYIGVVYSWIASFRAGEFLEEIANNPFVGMIWDHAEHIMGRPWQWMIGQGVRLEVMDDAVMAAAEKALTDRRAARDGVDVPAKTEGGTAPEEATDGGAELQESVSAPQGQAGGQDRGGEGGDSAGGGDKDHPADASQKRTRKGKLES
jgi:hypothetical protein